MAKLKMAQSKKVVTLDPEYPGDAPFIERDTAAVSAAGVGGVTLTPLASEGGVTLAPLRTRDIYSQQELSSRLDALVWALGIDLERSLYGQPQEDNDLPLLGRIRALEDEMRGVPRGFADVTRLIREVKTELDAVEARAVARYVDIDEELERLQAVAGEQEAKIVGVAAMYQTAITRRERVAERLDALERSIATDRDHLQDGLKIIWTRLQAVDAHIAQANVTLGQFSQWIQTAVYNFQVIDRHLETTGLIRGARHKVGSALATLGHHVGLKLAPLPPVPAPPVTAPSPTTEN